MLVVKPTIRNYPIQVCTLSLTSLWYHNISYAYFLKIGSLYIIVLFELMRFHFSYLCFVACVTWFDFLSAGALSDDTEDGIITVKGQTLNISSSSSASSPPPNALQLPQVTAENSPVSPSNAGGARSRPSSSRSTTELYKEKSLIDYICKTPSAGRRIVNSVLDEEPLFIEDSPVGTTPRHGV